MNNVAIDLSSPVGSISMTEAAYKMITRPAQNKQDCVKLAQTVGACGEPDDWCYYHSFKEGPTKTVNLFGRDVQQPQAGTCYMGPDKAQDLDLTINPASTAIEDSKNLPLYITPSASGTTAEQRYLKTTEQLIKRSQAQLKQQIAQDTAKNSSNEVALKILQSAIEKGLTFDQAKVEYEQGLAKYKEDQIAAEHQKEMGTVKGDLDSHGDQMGLLRQILVGKDAVLTERDTQLVTQEHEMQNLKTDLLKKGQNILKYQSRFTQKSRLTQVLMIVLFILTLFVFLMFTYYGVKLARGANTAA